MAEQVITVVTKVKDTYGNLLITDSEGKEHKINASRKNFAELEAVMIEGRAVKVDYKEYQGHPYIATAELFTGVMTDPPPAVEPEKLDIPPTPKPQVAPQAVGMMTKEIGDMIRAKYLVPIFGKQIANRLIVWYRSQTLGITQIDFDGKDLPEFE